MLEILELIYTNILFYVFGSAFYVGVTFILAIILIGVMFNLDGGSMLVLVTVGTVLGSFLFLPLWIATLIFIVILLIMATIIINMIGVNR